MVFSATPAAPARAEFDEESRSVNGTGETLPARQFELWPSSVAYGVSESLSLKALTLGSLVGAPALGFAYKLSLPRGIRVTPDGEISGIIKERFLGWKAGLAVGLNRGSRAQHSFAVALRAKSILVSEFGLNPKAAPEVVEVDEVGADDSELFKSVRRNYVWADFDYSYYTEAGNLAFIGADLLSPYVGFTWAFRYVHVGFVLVEINDTSLKLRLPFDIGLDQTFSYYLPLPFIYARF